MLGVKIHQPARREAPTDQLLPAVVDEHPFDEALAQHRVPQTTLLLHRQERLLRHEGPGIYSDPPWSRQAFAAVDLHALHAAARRCALEQVAADARERPSHLGSVEGQLFRDVKAGIAYADRPRVIRVADQSDRMPRGSETDGHLGTDREEFEIPSQRAIDVRVVLVPAVVAHPRPQQATADADRNLRRLLPPPAGFRSAVTPRRRW